jgi:hypothetical protein
VIQDKDYGEELNNGIKERVNITVLKLSRYDVLLSLKRLSFKIDLEKVDENWQILALIRASAIFECTSDF